MAPVSRVIKKKTASKCAKGRKRDHGKCAGAKTKNKQNRAKKVGLDRRGK
jgi:hypothetical protein